MPNFSKPSDALPLHLVGEAQTIRTNAEALAGLLNAWTEGVSDHVFQDSDKLSAVQEILRSAKIASSTLRVLVGKIESM